MGRWSPLTAGAVLLWGLQGSCAYALSADENSNPALARVSQHRDQGNWLEALAEIENLQQQFPQDDLLYRLQVLTLSDIGSAGRAWQLYQKRPELFTSEQRRQLIAKYLSKQVGWSLAYGASEDSRLAEAEDALAQMETLLAQEGLDATTAPLRVRHDRLILLNRLARHPQVREEYELLKRQGHTVPAYTFTAVADSLMATEHPEEAIPLLEAAMRNEPERDEVRTELAYAYLESNQPERAIRFLRQWHESQQPFLRHPQARQSYENWSYFESDLHLAMVLAYTDELPSAQRRLEHLVEMAPDHSGLQSSLGTVYLMRGWPRRALEQQQIAYTQDPRETPSRIGQFQAYVELQRDDLARPLHDDLVRRYPTEPAVARMQRSWRAHRGSQFHAYVEGGRSDDAGVSPLGSDDHRYGVEVRSPILDDRWRLLAFANRHRVDYPDQRLQPLRMGAGVEYRYRQLDAEAVLSHVNDGLGGVGVQAGIGWQFNDRWHLGLRAARNDEDASMQARAAGIAADSMALELDYWRSERTQWAAWASHYRYDDGNRRDLLGTSAEQRLMTRPTWQVTGLASAYLGRGSVDDVPYFNPSRDGEIELGLRIEHMPWQRYERHFRHQLEVSVGDYWQRGHGSALVPRVAYRHEWQFGFGRILEYGVSWSRPVYDGQREKHIGLDAAIHWGQ